MVALTSVVYDGNSYNVGYELINSGEKPSILILHGWGANKELMKQAFADKLDGYKHIYVDLAGFGASSIEKPLCSSDYTAIITLFLKQKKLRPSLILGHSFGGKIAVLLSEIYEPKALILLSSAGILWKKSLKTRSKIAFFKLFKRTGLQRFYKFFASKDVQGMSPVMYETFKKVVNEDFTEHFSRVKCKTLIFWGVYDTATPLKSGARIHSLIKHSSFATFEGDHFFFIQNAEFIASNIKFEVENLK